MIIFFAIWQRKSGYPDLIFVYYNMDYLLNTTTSTKKSKLNGKFYKYFSFSLLLSNKYKKSASSAALLRIIM